MHTHRRKSFFYHDLASVLTRELTSSEGFQRIQRTSLHSLTSDWKDQMSTSAQEKKQPDFDRCADELLRKKDGDLTKVNANQVSVLLGMEKSNQVTSACFKVWKARKEEEGHVHIASAPPELRQTAEKLISEKGNALLDVLLGLAGRAIEKVRADAEKVLSVLRDKIGLLEEECADKQEQIDQLNSRIEAMAEKAKHDDATISELRSRAETAEARAQVSDRKFDELLSKIQGSPTDGAPSKMQTKASIATRSDSEGIDISKYDFKD